MNSYRRKTTNKSLSVREVIFSRIQHLHALYEQARREDGQQTSKVIELLTRIGEAQTLYDMTERCNIL